jgi:Ca-activated chloride channel family protein
MARSHFIEGGVNRVILATDGDFNVGVTSHSELVDLVREGARDGVFLTVLGVGGGNYKDDRLELLADRGNGFYAYLDNDDEARRVLVEQVSGTLVTIAKDVKIQVEFNPAQVVSYRLLGYENRRLADRDFNDDTVDAGELGAGHSVVALYELVPGAAADQSPEVDALRYQTARQPNVTASSGEVLTVKLRYKEPDGDTSRLIEERLFLADQGPMGEDFSLAAGVALFGMILRDSKHTGQGTLADARMLVEGGRGEDPAGRRAELSHLIHVAEASVLPGR